MFVSPARITDGFFVTDAIMTRAVLHMCIADEAALKDQYSFKGASGVKPCFCCRNVISHDRGRERARPIGDYVVTICCGDTTKFDLATDEDIWRTYDNLKAMVGVVNKTNIDKLEKASGMNYNPHGLLHDEELRKYVRPASTTRLDPMHCLVANGVCTTEVHVFLVAMKGTLGIGFTELSEFASHKWKWWGTSANLSKFFTPTKETACKESFKADASELFMVMTLLRHFAHAVVRPTGLLVAECTSFEAMCVVTDSYLAGKYATHVNLGRDQLPSAAEAHFRAHMAAYGDQYMRPKNHYTLHLGMQLRLDSFLVDCFTLERKHQLLKSVATNVKNTKVFERSVLTYALLQQIVTTRVGDGLVGPTKLAGGMRHCRKLKRGAVTYNANDLLFCDGKCCYIRSCTADALIVSMGEKISAPSMSTSKWSFGDALVGTPLNQPFELVTPYCWTFVTSDSALVLHSAYLSV